MKSCRMHPSTSAGTPRTQRAPKIPRPRIRNITKTEIEFLSHRRSDVNRKGIKSTHCGSHYNTTNPIRIHFTSPNVGSWERNKPIWVPTKNIRGAKAAIINASKLHGTRNQDSKTVRNRNELSQPPRENSDISDERLEPWSFLAGALRTSQVGKYA